MTEFLLPLAVVGLITTLLMGVFVLLRNVRERRHSYWKRRLALPDEPESLVGNLVKPGKPRQWNDQLDQSFEQMMQRTGLGWSAELALGWILLAGIVLGGLLLLWRWELWLAGIGLLAGMGGPLLIFLVMQSRWRLSLRNQIPDTLFLLARSLRAGLSLEQALENVAESGSKPMAGEFRRGVQQIHLGLTAPAALQNMSRRINLDDFDVFVTIVTLHRNIGGNLTMLLDRVATSTRDRNLFRGYFRTATALARATAIALAAGAPFIFLLYSFWQPDFVTRFTSSENGIRLLIAAGSLEVIGLVWISYLLRSRY
jgi:tight adherence protein B